MRSASSAMRPTIPSTEVCYISNASILGAMTTESPLVPAQADGF